MVVIVLGSGPGLSNSSRICAVTGEAVWRHPGTLATDPPLLGPGTVWPLVTTCVAPGLACDAAMSPGYLYLVSKDPSNLLSVSLQTSVTSSKSQNHIGRKDKGMQRSNLGLIEM